MLFRKIGFTGQGKIQLGYIDKETSHSKQLKFSETLTLLFDFSNQFCVGYYDMQTKTSYPCPESKTNTKECGTCLARTGFNPAFYNTTNISPQQIERNLQPHILYLADFGGDFIKVGISHHSRKLGRLVEQGARAAIVLDQVSSANVARDYESKIAQLTGFRESVRTETKLKLLEQVFDFETSKKRLAAAHDRITKSLGIDFNCEIKALDKFYSNRQLTTDFAFLPQNLAAVISGKIIALVGSFLFLENDQDTIVVNTKDLVGYNFELSDKIIKVKLPDFQPRLF